MKNLKKIIGTALIALAPTGALASSHREAPAISQDPAADNTDVYAWVTPGTHDNLIVLANYIPLEEPSGGPNFHSLSDDVLYEIHIAKGGGIANDFATYQIRTTTSGFGAGDQNNPDQNVVLSGVNFFSQISGQTQTYTITRIDSSGKHVLGSGLSVAPPNIGPRTDADAYSATIGAGFAYDDAHIASTFVHTLSDQSLAFVGPRDDGFYVDLGGVFDLANLRRNGTAQDGVAGYNVHTIALQIPLTQLGFASVPTTTSKANSLAVWAGASRRKVTVLHNDGTHETSGPFVQVSRQGLPLINEAVIGLDDKDSWNALKPKDDVPVFGGYFLNPVLVRDAVVVGILTTPTGVDRGRTDILDVISLNIPPFNLGVQLANDATNEIGDVIRVDPTHDSAFPNGRSLQGTADIFGNPMGADQEKGDVTDIELSLILTKNPNPVAATGGTGISDGVQHNDKTFLTTFPFLALPFRGFDEGHGKPTAP